MLDKSVEYKNIIMKIQWDKIKSIAKPILPDGFSFRFFTAGDEIHWARIEASVLEFDSVDLARSYFEMSYLPHKENLEKRCVFVVDRSGLPIATASSWFADSELGYQASLHWVAVCPEYQGLGIGKAITQQALINFRNLEPNNPVFLHTQTWSHTAVKLYHDLGFVIAKKDRLGNNNTRDGVTKIYQNDFEEAMQVLEKVLDYEYINKFFSNAS